MDETELRAHIVRRLAQGVPENDVILEVSRRAGIPWPEAEALVSDTAAYEEPAISRRQFPLLALLSVTSVIGGLVLAGSSTIAFLSPLLAARASRGAPDLLDPAILLLWVTTHLEYLGGIVLGAAMIAGGLFGLGKAGVYLFAR